MKLKTMLDLDNKMKISLDQIKEIIQDVDDILIEDGDIMILLNNILKNLESLRYRLNEAENLTENEFDDIEHKYYQIINQN